MKNKYIRNNRTGEVSEQTDMPDGTFFLFGIKDSRNGDVLEEISEEEFRGVSNKSKTFKDEIIEVIKDGMNPKIPQIMNFTGVVHQIIQSLLNRLPKKKVRTVESFADKRIGEEYQPWKNGFNQALKELTEIINK